MFAYAGCRTSRERNARGKGIEVYRVHGADQRWEHATTVPHESNPSFLAFSRDQRFLYAVHGDFSEISAYVVDRASGGLRFINTEFTDGRNLVHLAIDATGRWVVASNHVTGSLVSLPIRADGSLGPLASKLQVTGTPGPRTHHQPGPKPHHNPFDPQGRFVVVADKGIDELYAVRLDPDSGALEIAQRVRTRPGSGPRHLDFHPSAPYFYVINELDFTIATYRYDAADATMEPVQILPAVPDTWTGRNSGAEIWVDRRGRFVYVSNRGHDSIGVFAVDAESKRLRPVQWVATQGRTPRFFCLDPGGRFLYACNEDSDSIVQFKVDPASGELSPTAQVVHTGSPTCLVFG